MFETSPGSNRFTFQGPDGAEITTRAVELIPPPAPMLSRTAQKIVVEQSDMVTVTVGSSSYAFDPKTRLLTAAKRSGIDLFTNLRPTIWRPLTLSETSIESGENKLDNPPDLNNFTATATAWKVDAQPDHVAIHATVLCTINDKNRFTAELDYSIDAAGRLSVRYAYMPQVQTPWLSQVGLSADLAPAVKELSWFGLGPLDTFPNEKTAGVLGLYAGPLGSELVNGNKTTRWVEASGQAGTVHFENTGYLHHDPAGSARIDLLSATLGRPTKFGRPEPPEHQLNIHAGKPFTGESTISLKS